MQKFLGLLYYLFHNFNLMLIMIGDDYLKKNEKMRVYVNAERKVTIEYVYKVKSNFFLYQKFLGFYI